MKKGISIILAVLIILQMMGNVAIGIYYHLNKNYIIKKICINRNNPAVKCNGQCYLSNQLKKAEQGEKQNAQFFKQRNEIFTNNNYSNTLCRLSGCKPVGFVAYRPFAPPADNYNFLFKPPAYQLFYG